ncbi:cytochrome c oxidase subunit 3 [Flavicella sediminum]|uniref:cytochrome c oxidase subunit 3 n=1 Tax=Flavicella sediminum TaxID=2585141 RepID=UPI0011248240|nr:cytochrome c oxidase subunit 3 [Flavicella sediminum]
MIKETLELELQEGKKKTAKPMMWISMVSMTMMFAGLTSAYVISSNREDWISFELPQAFFLSSLFIVLSSITLHFSKVAIRKSNRNLATLLLLATLVFGLGFVFEQFQGFEALKSMGLYFTGPESAVSSSMLLVIVFAHVIHVAVGVICLFVIIYNHFKLRYTANNMLGLELGAIFWHFVDLLWIGLFCFFYFNT